MATATAQVSAEEFAGQFMDTPFVELVRETDTVRDETAPPGFSCRVSEFLED